MQVTISVGGRFHAFDLAQQLQKRGFLQSLITSYPKFKASDWGIARNKVETVLSHEVLSRAIRKINRHEFESYLNFRYDRIAAEKLSPHADIVLAWSGMALATHARARKLRAKTVLERGSSHILYQDRLLREEQELTGARVERPDPRTMARECEEYEQADFICVPSTFAYGSFINQGTPPSKLLITPLGVDADLFRPAPKEDSKFRIVHCGSLSIRKGVHYLLQAFHELKLKDAELCFVGGKSPEVEPYLKRYGGPNVVLRGAFPESELRKEYSRASVSCLASIEEGFARVLSQAMSCGIPVICTENSGGHDLVRPGIDGFVVPIRSVEALKEKLVFLYTNRDRARGMGEAARQRILDGFTSDHYGDRVVGEYSRVLGIAAEAVPVGANIANGGSEKP
jgi:glycosyltransferase involved in cell wall biosynthesis